MHSKLLLSALAASGASAETATTSQRTSAESRLPSLVTSITFNTTSTAGINTTITISTSTSRSVRQSATTPSPSSSSSSSSIETTLEPSRKLTTTSLVEASSSTSLAEASSTSPSPIAEISSAEPTRPLERPTSVQDKETVETGAKPVAVTIPPPNNRGTAVGIAFGAFGKQCDAHYSDEIAANI
ncbi:hypothetical protein NLG97_g2526 [Lecanicillium saksenae]|uniref:Uncharacterized protein n=1 Tax=Lecanicillium saksenae TaxID=468837 RepID=A0ACC1R3Y2_9HYPO|nr:hypothetical protein NLG97_g2526 [Lecanicillium saksenae]